MFSTVSMKSMNGHVKCGRLAHGSISCRRNTWGHHQQRAGRVAWKRSIESSAGNECSWWVGSNAEKWHHWLERRRTAASSVEEEANHLGRPSTIVGDAFENRRREENIDISCSCFPVITPCALSQPRSTGRRVAHRGGCDEAWFSTV